MQTIIEAICRQAYGEVPSDIQRIQLGSVNLVHRVCLPGGDWILRMRAVTAAVNEYRKEAWCRAAAARVGIPVAESGQIGICGEYAFGFERVIEGVNGSLCPERAAEVWRALGDYARRLHRVPVQGFGVDFDAADRFYSGYSPTWSDHLRHNIEPLTMDDFMLDCGVYTARQQPMIRAAFERLKKNPPVIGLNHGDLSMRNVMVKGDLVYLIDFGCAYADAVPYGDLITAGFQSEEDRNRFLEGYGLTAGQASGEICLALAMLHHFDKLRWAHTRPVDQKPYIERATRCAQALCATMC